jgi:hypothetical protein
VKRLLRIHGWKVTTNPGAGGAAYLQLLRYN